MDLEEMQSRWRQLDEKIDRTLKLESELLRISIAQPAKRRMQWASVGPVFDFLFCILVVNLSGNVLWQHRQEWGLVLPAVVLIAAAVVLSIDTIFHFQKMSEVDWGRPVSEIQRALTRVHLGRVRQLKWILLMAPLIGFCMFILGLQGLGDLGAVPIRILEKLDRTWILCNYAFGLIFPVVGHLLLHYLGMKYQGQGWWLSLINSLSGASLQKTRQEVDRWRELELEHA